MFLNELKAILTPDHRSIEKPHLEVNKIDGGYELSYGKMYEAPTLNFSALMKLSELFGTENIDVDNYSRGGCETCDWGSDYGHTIQVREITKNADELNKLVGKGDLYEKRKK